MSVRRIDEKTWQAECKHGKDETWTLQRETEYLAQRSLNAHHRECLPYKLRTQLPEEDEHHPLSVLGVWTVMLAEDYGLTSPDPITVTSAAAFLEENLHRMAQDEAQDFPLLAREIRKCRSHLEAVLRDSMSPERGVPCPTCGTENGQLVRLVREYGHWCTEADCERIHYLDDSGDRWQCPRFAEHWWTLDAYENYLTERRSA